MGVVVRERKYSLKQETVRIESEDDLLPSLFSSRRIKESYE